jgi:tRNA(fMet)-specific endonuclease VapC
MRFLLDTNTCIRFLNGRAPAVKERLIAMADDDIAVCSVVKAEMFAGAEKSRDPQRSRALQDEFFARYVSLPFDDRAADRYGRVRAHLERQGRPIGPNDLMIAAITLANGVTLVTHNTDEFARVPDMLLEDWELPR